MIVCDENTYRALLQAYSCALKAKRVPWDSPIPPETARGVISLARSHSILPMLAQTVYETEAFKTEPLLLNSLIREARQLTTLQACRTADFLLLYRELASRGVRPLVTKGIMCRVLCPYPDQRLSVDEDMLVTEEEFPHLHELLLELGFNLVDPNCSPAEDYEVSYIDEERDLYLEVHKRFFEPDSDAYGDCNEPFEGAIDRAVDIEISGVVFRTLAPTDHLLYLFCHAYKHFLHGGVGIRQVGDMCMFACRYADEIDGKHIAECCRKLHIDRFAAALMKIGKERLDIGVPEIFAVSPDTEHLLEDVLSGGSYGTSDVDRAHSSNITLEAVASHKRGRRSKGALGSVFLPRKALEGRYPYLKKAPVLLPVAWAQRVWGYLFGEKRVSPAESLRIGRERTALLKEYGIIE